MVLFVFCSYPVFAASSTDFIDIGGVYETNFGDLAITQRGNWITGSYPTGAIEGTIIGNTVNGSWHQAYSKGKFVFEFQPDAYSFKGKWGIGDETPHSGWDGSRKQYSTNRLSSQIRTTPYAIITGTYGSTYGDIEFTQTGSMVEATYPTGSIKGTMEGKVLTGQWKEESSSGLVRFEFSSDLSTFDGYWGSGEEQPTSKWDGERKSLIQPQSFASEATPPRLVTIGSAYDSDYGNIVFWQSGDYVIGSYPSGSIEGYLSGSTLEGRWLESSGSGSLRFEFSANGDRFEGWWSYSTGALVNKWDGIATTRPILHVESTNVSSVRNELNGTFSSSFGDIVFSQEGSRIKGTYPTGTIEGTMVGTVLDGYWIESSGKGKIRFVFSSDLSEFDGTYGYGEDAPTSYWNGEKQ